MGTEAEVGIRCYVTAEGPAAPAFPGAILKHRFTDFQVREVPLGPAAAGAPPAAPLRLRSLAAPAAELSSAAPPPPPDDAAGAGAEAAEAEAAELAGLVGAAAAGRFRRYAEGLAAEGAGRAAAAEPFEFDADGDKAHRTAVHQFFRASRAFAGFVTDTKPAARPGAAPAVRVLPKAALAGPGHKKRKRKGGGWFSDAEAWPGGKEAPFCEFTLHKVNLDTSHCLHLLGKALRVNPKAFGFAGTKDKRAVTLQRCTAFKVSARRLAAVNGRIPGVHVGDFAYVAEAKRLGDLAGNRFSVVLRNLDAAAEADLAAAAARVRAAGFVNYFGLQRFGSSRVRTHRVGRALLRGDWEEAIRLILDPEAKGRGKNGGPVAEACRRFLADWDGRALLQALPRRLTAECAIAAAAQRLDRADLVGMLSQIPKHLRSMYVHSYQSYLWNCAASERLSAFPKTHAVAGDLVLVERAGPAPQGRERRHDFAEVRVVTAAEEAARSVGIAAVVLPLVGKYARPPENAVGRVFRDLAAADGIDLDAPAHSVGEFSLAGQPGAYRKLVHVPVHFAWETIPYADADADLCATDVDLLLGGGAPKAGGEGEAGAAEPAGKLALKLDMQLATSCYATMAIRELLKTSTATEFHSALSARQERGSGAPAAGAP